MSCSITSWPSVACFRAAAALESFSAAANQLNLTHSAISRAVRLLENDLGTQLFTRQNRRVLLTDDGRSFAKAVSAGLGEIEAVAQAIKQKQRDRPLTLSCEPTLLMRWLIPRFASFRSQHPNIEINLSAGGGSVALGAGIDLAIRRNDFIWPSTYHTAHLFDERIGPVCRPDLATPGLIDTLPILHSKTRLQAWADWTALSGRPPQQKPKQEFEHFYFSIQAAIAGLGIAIGPWHLVQDDLASGLLCAPYGFIADASSYHLLSISEFTPNARTTILRDWLHRAAQNDP
jgi:LysR family transcriptional regulator, glycine cleavage system transcriptional activator